MAEKICISMRSKQISDQASKRMNPNFLSDTPGVIIGYYPIRGKAQMPRLLCEYLSIGYKDLLFTPKTWMDFKNTQQLDWTFEQLPFLKDGEIIVTETFPICLYLIHKAGRKDLLGSSILQQIQVDTMLCDVEPVSYLKAAFVNNRQMTPQVKEEAVEKLWARILRPRLSKMEIEASALFFYENLTLIDFYIYETFYYLHMTCPQKIGQFPKLLQICQRFQQIPQIKAYEESKRCIKQVCPIKFSLTWREKIRERGKTL